MSRRLIPFMLLFLAISAEANSVKIRRVVIDGVRVDLIEPPEEKRSQGSLVVLFYQTEREGSSDKFIAGRIWRREGVVTRIQGESSKDGTIRLRVFLQRVGSNKEDEVLFELPVRGSKISPYVLLAGLQPREETAYLPPSALGTENSNAKHQSLE